MDVEVQRAGVGGKVAAPSDRECRSRPGLVAFVSNIAYIALMEVRNVP